MKIGIYALAKNEAKHVPAWAESCADADVIVVTDTGSTDDTVQLLEAADVEVARGYVCPWRWDDAHNLSMHHLPPSIDVAIRLDLDERLAPGWREAVERSWKDGVNQLKYRYIWSWKAPGVPGLEFACDRVHSRHGWRWTQATHEGLVCWSGDRKDAFALGLEVHHHRDPGKQHKSDLSLLQVAVREAPNDARARWYLAREMDYAGLPEAASEFLSYLKMAGGAATERSYARRALHRLTGDTSQLEKAAEECPNEPDAWAAMALICYRVGKWQDCHRHAMRAIEATATSHATDPDAKGRAYDLAAVSSWELGMRPQALTYARAAVARLPRDPRLQTNVDVMARILEGEPCPTSENSPKDLPMGSAT